MPEIWYNTNESQPAWVLILVRLFTNKNLRKVPLPNALVSQLAKQDNNNTYFMGLLRGLNRLIHVKYLRIMPAYTLTTKRSLLLSCKNNQHKIKRQ